MYIMPSNRVRIPIDMRPENVDATRLRGWHLPALMDAWRKTADPVARQALRRATVLLLQRLRPEDAAYLDITHVVDLHRLLESADTDLVLATLHALTVVGGQESIAPLKRLMSDGTRRPDARIMQAAASALPILAARAELLEWLAQP